MENFGRLSPEEQEAKLLGPALESPDGIHQLDNPPNTDDAARAFFVVCTVIVTLMALVRVYSRVFVIKQAHVEDYLGLLSLPPYYFAIWTAFRVVDEGGFLVHQWDLRLMNFLEALRGDMSLVSVCEITIKKIFVWFRIGYGLVLFFIKVAIIREWIRVFLPRGKRNVFWWSCTGIILVNTLLYICLFALTAVQCRPLRKTWQPWVSGTCMNRGAMDLSSSTSNLVIDVCMLLLPQKIIWSLKITRGRKIGISAIFSVGVITVASAAGRIHAVRATEYHGDTAYGAPVVVIWALAELTGGMIVFCTPAFPSALKGVGRVARGTLPGPWTRLFGSSSHIASTNADTKSSHTWPRHGGSQKMSFDIPPQSFAMADATWGWNENKVERTYSHSHGREIPIDGIVKTTKFESRAEPLTTLRDNQGVVGV